MNSYIIFFKNKRLEVEAETSLQAQRKAAKLLKVKHAYQITVCLAEKNGMPIIHRADF